MSARRPKAPSARRGVALIAVLWIVAALSIIVTGVVYAVRGELRQVSVARQAVEAVALGEAAITLVLQDMRAAPQRSAALARVDTVFANRSIPVEVMPLTGLIDVSSASEALLAQLYRVAGGLPQAQAQALAAATLETRNQRDGRGRPLGFEAVQDLVRVPGMAYDLYARLLPLITAESQGAGQVNALAAPADVLTVLANGNAERAGSLATARATNPQGTVDTTALQAEFVANTSSSRYRLMAYVPTADGATVAVSRSVDLRPDSRAGLPWRFFHAEHWTIVPPRRGF
ncbi:MAG: type II secretion system protein GspK [Burkholderiaceae bacterium]|nr:type II secretion system protein GspK [Burkholderiaceae bacterium]